ncbi:DUF3857 domain-containing protein [Tenacibaculum geojense]|uniref:DUF3857 domain-containing protein n=1 Tax=Tenacibaculum geojense TaxID=915352 RepID=A0ABW3JSW8_9FLAO
MKKTILILCIIISQTLISQEIKFGKVSKKELQETFYDKDSSASASYLLKKRRTYFTYNNTSGFLVVSEYHERIKIYTKEGLDYATKKINYYFPESGDRESINSLKGYTFNIEDGKIEKEKLSKKNIFEDRISKFRKEKKITFPAVKIGSVIDVKYTLTSPFWTIEDLNFQYSIPVKRLDYQVETPEYIVFNKRAKGFFSIPVAVSKKSSALTPGSTITFTTTVDKFETEDIKAINPNEPYVGNINNYRGGVSYELSSTQFPNSMFKNYALDWEDVCKTIYKSSAFGVELHKSSYYKEDLNNIISNSSSEIETIARVFTHVKSKLNWNEYYGKYTDKGVRKAYKDGVGNVAEINLILTSMLRSANIDANPVLVSSKNNGIPVFPTLKGFNYVITKVNLANGQYILLDATESYSFPNLLPYRALNWYGKEVLEGGKIRDVKLAPSTVAKDTNFMNITINEEGTVEGMIRKSLSGHLAMFHRKSNNHKKDEEIITELEDKYNIEIDEYNIHNKLDLSKGITQSFKFTSEDFVEEINGKLYINPLLFLALNENPFKSKERSFPIDFVVPWEDKYSISIEIPKGYNVESFPQEIAIGLPDNIGTFKYIMVNDGKKLKLMSQTTFKQNMIGANYYEFVKEFYSQLVKKQSEKIVFIKS